MMFARAIYDWAIETFGVVATLQEERAMRFVEEAIELGHAMGLREAHMEGLIARVYSRDAGEIEQEIGQAQMTLECLAESRGLCADELARQEFDRVRALPRDYFVKRQNAKAAIGIAHLCRTCSAPTSSSGLCESCSPYMFRGDTVPPEVAR